MMPPSSASESVSSRVVNDDAIATMLPCPSMAPLWSTAWETATGRDHSQPLKGRHGASCPGRGIPSRSTGASVSPGRAGTEEAPCNDAPVDPDQSVEERPRIRGRTASLGRELVRGLLLAPKRGTAVGPNGMLLSSARRICGSSNVSDAGTRPCDGLWSGTDALRGSMTGVGTSYEIVRVCTSRRRERAGEGISGMDCSRARGFGDPFSSGAVRPCKSGSAGWTGGYCIESECASSVSSCHGHFVPHDDEWAAGTHRFAGGSR